MYLFIFTCGLFTTFRNKISSKSQQIANLLISNVLMSKFNHQQIIIDLFRSFHKDDLAKFAFKQLHIKLGKQQTS